MPSSACLSHSRIWSLELQLYLFIIWTVDEGEYSTASTLGKESVAPSEWDAGRTQQFVWKPRKRENFLLVLGFEALFLCHRYHYCIWLLFRIYRVHVLAMKLETLLDMVYIVMFLKLVRRQCVQIRKRLFKSVYVNIASNV